MQLLLKKLQQLIGFESLKFQLVMLMKYNGTKQ